MKNIENKLSKYNIKPTAMRVLVLKVLVDQKTAICLSDLENKFDRADKVTLYRTLKTFEKNKLIHSINDGTGVVKYALCNENCVCDTEDLHAHFHCTKCKLTYCLNDISMPSIALPLNFTLDTINVVVKGKCFNCAK